MVDYNIDHSSYHPDSHGGDNDKAYGSFKKDFHKEVIGIDRNIRKMRDSHNVALAEANKAVEYDFEKDSDSLKQYGDDLISHFEKIIREQHGYDDKRKVPAELFLQTFGFDQKELYRLATVHGRDAPRAIEQRLAGKVQNELQSQYISLGNKYIVDQVTAKHGSKYMGLDTMDDFDEKGVSPDAVKQVLTQYGTNNKVVAPAMLGTNMRKSSLEELVNKSGKKKAA
jgi:hypothetical protein